MIWPRYHADLETCVHLSPCSVVAGFHALPNPCLSSTRYKAYKREIARFVSLTASKDIKRPGFHMLHMQAMQAPQRLRKAVPRRARVEGLLGGLPLLFPRSVPGAAVY